MTPAHPSHRHCQQLAGGLFLHLRRGAHGLDRHLLRHRGQGQQDPVFLPGLRRLHLRRLLHADGQPAACRGGLSYGTDVTAPGPDDAGNNILSVGIDYTHDFEDWNLTIGGGGEWAFTQYTSAGGTTNNKPSWYQAGIQIGIGDFSIGASGAYYVNYAHAGYAATTASSSDDGWVVSGGASYTLDAWSFGLQGVFGSFQQNASVILGTSVPGVSAQNEKMWGVSLNGAYALGREISLEGRSPIPTRITAISRPSVSPCRSPLSGRAVPASTPAMSIPGRSTWGRRSTSDRRVS